ncbi:V8-like Glu-specific endopeptidase [Rhodovulum bhavnagarense]|uniref:V8-like Glu-specific endopeptidase n=1 Tax=Rhodovulum bhavnagarense TaxID=992286 RepID=A0A4R2RUK8_9RHOB|nr:S1 family peptidase [Rhodovulum bhavnagarense]TCP62825.1 V8-like Glu-specific endopeptidase [Rhodovulum bhavnagarense]
MPRKTVMFSILWLLLLWVSPAAAGSTLQVLQTGDDARGWQAVGRLELGGGGFCTGTLIAPDLVLTAAHCLYDTDSAKAIDLGRVRFLAGLRNGRAEAYRDIRRAVVHPRYQDLDADRMTRVANDLALLQLQHPIRLPGLVPFATVSDISAGDPVDVVSYAREREEAPSLEQSCRVMARRTAILVLSCSVDFGASGAPVFHVDGGVARIVSVVSAKADSNGQPVALGARVRDEVAVLQARLAADEGVIGPGVPPLRRFGQGTARGTGGAKFVTP